MEDGIRLLRIRTVLGTPVDFEELLPAVDSISDAEWRLKSFVEVRRDEYRYGRPPCVENVLPGSEIVARLRGRPSVGPWTAGNTVATT